jgi:hypothetical protein
MKRLVEKFKKLVWWGKDRLHGITLRRAQPEPDREKSQKLAPSYMGIPPPYGSSLYSCFEAQPKTSLFYQHFRVLLLLCFFSLKLIYYGWKELYFN